MSEGGSQQVQEAFREHHEEIKRRSNAVHSDTPAEHSDAFERVETDVVLPLRTEGQEVILFSVSHISMSPIAEVPTNPAIRFYGAFETAEDCLEHANQVARLDPSCNLQMGRVQEWNMAARSQDRLQDNVGCRAHVQNLLEEHARKLGKHKQDFEENRSKRQGGVHDQEAVKAEKDKAAKAAEEAAKRETANQEQAELRKAPRLPRGGEARDCNFAVVSFIKDTIQPIPEFGFKLYACFSDTKTADIYVRNVLGNEEKEHDIDVVTVGEWLHPQAVEGNKLQSEIWRAGELSSIMSSHRQQPNKVESFKRWRESAPASSAPSAESSSIDVSDDAPVTESTTGGVEGLLDAEHLLQSEVAQ